MAGSGKKTVRFTANCTVVLAFFVTLFFPLGYFVVSYQYTLGNLEAETEINAQIIGGITDLTVESWVKEEPRLHAILRHELHPEHPEMHMVRTATGQVIAYGGKPLKEPVIARSSPILHQGKLVGSIDVTRSIRPILEKTGLVALLGLGIGTVVFILLPFRTINSANRKLQDSYNFLTRVMESSANLLVVLELDGTISMVNGRCLEVSGYRADELDGNRVERLLRPECVGEILEQLQQVASGAAEIVKFETDLLQKDGSAIAIACGATPVYEEGKIAGIVLSVENVTERRRAVEQLLSAKEYTENLIQAACVMILGLDLRGNVTLFNQTAEEVTGYGAEELLGRNWFETVMGAEAFYKMCMAPALSCNGTRSVFESQIVTKSGALRTISWRNSSIVEHDATIGTLCFGIDVTEHRKVEAQLRQSQKMESVGQLAGGVAHDFNNMLSVILGYAQLCQIETESGSPIDLYLKEIINAGERSRDMVRKLLAFSRKEIISPRAVNLNSHCLEIEKTLSRLIGEEILLHFLPAAELWTVRIDPSQVDQILMNLAVNARDAMPGGGNLTISTQNALIDEAFCDYHLDAKPGDYACMTVEDTGLGMDREVVKRIFEPFFTTKGVGQGTGLGLATVYGIVTQNGGFIDVESEPGDGTTFRIYLPKMAEEPEPELKPSPATLTGTGTVLVVEDDAMLRVMATQMLEKIGYRVLQAESPQSALSICRDPGTEIDFILSDVVMPEMNGLEMAKGIAALRPETKVLFMTGYSSEMIAKRGIIAEQGMHYIQKPFNMEGLHAKIAEMQGG